LISKGGSGCFQLSFELDATDDAAAAAAAAGGDADITLVKSGERMYQCDG